MNWAAMARRADDPRGFNRAVAALFALGLALRLVWALRGDYFRPIASEMYLIAQAFARTGTIADAYHLGSGPTAHAAPLWPAFAGSIYRVVGRDGPVVEAVLSAAALAFVAVSVLLLNRAMARLGTPALARLGAIAFVALVPLNFELEVVASRVWEQAIAAALMALVLWLVIRLDVRRVGWATLTGLAALAAPFVMVSPAAALGAFGCIGLLALRRGGAGAAGGVAAFVGVTALSAVFVVALSYPWALRNEAVFGEKIWSRSNFGFVFAEGFHPAAVAPANPRKTFVDRMAEIDPFERSRGFAAMTAAGGEAGYNHAMTAATMAWVRANPGDAARIAVRHTGEFFLPPRWHWHVYSDKSAGTAAKQALVWAIAILGFGGVAWGLRRDSRFLYAAAMLVLPVAPYILAQPILRYRYLITTLLVFLAADLLARLAKRFSRAGTLPSARR